MIDSIHGDGKWDKPWKVSPIKPISPVNSNPVIGKCHKCGMEMRRMMWFSCRTNGCPYFRKVTL